MSTITYQNIEVEGFPFAKINELYISHSPNVHASATVIGEISKEEGEDCIKRSDETTGVLIKTTAKNQNKKLFFGCIKNMTLEASTDYYVLKVELASMSSRLDVQKKNKSFQNKGKTHEEILNETLEGAGHVDLTVSDKPIGEMIMQYNETNWEFIKRIASKFNASVMTNIVSEKPLVTVGLPTSGKSYELDTVSFQYGMNSDSFQSVSGNYMAAGSGEVMPEDFAGAQADSYTYGYVGDLITFNGASKRIKTIVSKLVDGILLNSYTLAGSGDAGGAKGKGASFQDTLLKKIEDDIKDRIQKAAEDAITKLEKAVGGSLEDMKDALKEAAGVLKEAANLKAYVGQLAYNTAADLIENVFLGKGQAYQDAASQVAALLRGEAAWKNGAVFKETLLNGSAILLDAVGLENKNFGEIAKTGVDLLRSVATGGKEGFLKETCNQGSALLKKIPLIGEQAAVILNKIPEGSAAIRNEVYRQAAEMIGASGIPLAEQAAAILSQAPEGISAVRNASYLQVAALIAAMGIPMGPEVAAVLSQIPNGTKARQNETYKQLGELLKKSGIPLGEEAAAVLGQVSNGTKARQDETYRQIAEAIKKSGLPLGEEAAAILAQVPNGTKARQGEMYIQLGELFKKSGLPGADEIAAVLGEVKNGTKARQGAMYEQLGILMKNNDIPLSEEMAAVLAQVKNGTKARQGEMYDQLGVLLKKGEVPGADEIAAVLSEIKNGTKARQGATYEQLGVLLNKTGLPGAGEIANVLSEIKNGTKARQAATYVQLGELVKQTGLPGASELSSILGKAPEGIAAVRKEVYKQAGALLEGVPLGDKAAAILAVASEGQTAILKETFNQVASMLEGNGLGDKAAAILRIATEGQAEILKEGFNQVASLMEGTALGDKAAAILRAAGGGKAALLKEGCNQVASLLKGLPMGDKAAAIVRAAAGGQEAILKEAYNQGVSILKDFIKDKNIVTKEVLAEGMKTFDKEALGKGELKDVVSQVGFGAAPEAPAAVKKTQQAVAGGFIQPEAKNEQSSGRMFTGTVQAVERDKVQVFLSDIDDAFDGSTTHWFPYSTAYSSSDGSGWYCMPEIGDTVRVFFPSNKEDDAFAASSVNVSPLKNPRHKSWRAPGGKEILLTDEGICIICDKEKIFIDMTDKNGINIYADKSVNIVSKGTVSIESEKMVEIKATNNIIIGTENSYCDIREDAITIASKQVLIS